MQPSYPGVPLTSRKAPSSAGRLRSTFKTIAIVVAGVSVLSVALVTSPAAVASIPSPRDEGDTKSGQMTPAEKLSPEKRAVRLPKGRTYPEHLKYGTSWQEPVLCGPNALYVLLRLSGIQADREQLKQLIPITPTGSNLADLSRAATKLGLSHDVRKVSQTDLFRLTPPFLVHEDVRSSDSEVPDSGHFFVIVRFKDNGQVGMIDGVSGMYQFVEPARFDRSFSGYVLVPRVKFLGIPTRWVWSILYALAAVIAVMAGALAFLSRPVAERRAPVATAA